MAGDRGEQGTGPAVTAAGIGASAPADMVVAYSRRIPGARSFRFPLRPASAIVAVALAGVTVGSVLVTRHVVDDQEQRLLEQRLAEVQAFVPTLLAPTETTLQLIGAVAATAGVDAAAAVIAATVPPGAPGTIAVVEDRGGDFVVVAAGGGLEPGDSVSVDRAQLLTRATSADDTVATVLPGDGGGTVAVLARATGTLVAFQEIPLNPTQPVAADEDSPFRDLRVALFAASTRDPDRLLLTTEADLPLSGDIVSAPVSIGAEEWLVVANARTPLVGSLAEAVPWIILAAGLLATLAAAAVVEVLGRRRQYALALVDERTHDLNVARLDLERLLSAGRTVVMRTSGGDLRAEYVSPNSERVLGSPAADLVGGRPFSDQVHDDDRAAVESAMQRVASGGSGSEDLEFRYCADDEPRWVSAQIVPDTDVDGDGDGSSDGRAGLLCYLVDIDERRRAELALGEREATLEAVLSASPDPIVMLDPSGTITAASAATMRLLGRQPRELEGTTVGAVSHPDDRDRLAAALDQLRSGAGEPVAVQFRASHADGRWVVVESQLARLEHGDTAEPAIVAVTRDVTERARLEEAREQARLSAEAANQSKSEFLSRMSHELRTPLNAVLGFGQLLEMGELDEEQREAAEQILRGGRHLLTLIDEVLDISRIESGTVTLSPEPVLLVEIVNEAVSLIAPLAAQASVNVVADPGSTCDCYVLADRQRVKQILLNLLSNGVKYNRVGGTVAVTCGAGEDGRVTIAVADTGPGIRPEQLGLVFTPFERLGAEHTGIEGTGIGLALSRRLAEAMSGSLDVTSEMGRGTTFTLELPPAEGPVERYERLDNGAPDVEPAPSEPVAVRRVLHIEDNLSNLRLIERILSKRNDVEVVGAMQGRLGLELARDHKPAVILLDLHLPDVDGDDVLRRLRGAPDTAGIPVIIVSADATPRQAQRLLAAGASAYLTKPINVKVLLATLDELLADSGEAT